MWMLVGVMNAKPGQPYYRPGGWLWTGYRWMQENNTYCGKKHILSCTC